MNKKDIHKKYLEARRLIQNDKYEEAKSILEEILLEYKETPTLLYAYGLCLYSLEMYNDAVNVLRKVVFLKPYDEKASMLYFLILHSQGKVDDAFTEIRRYLSISRSDHYSELIKDLNKHDIDNNE